MGEFIGGLGLMLVLMVVSFLFGRVVQADKDYSKFPALIEQLRPCAQHPMELLKFDGDTYGCAFGKWSIQR